MRVARAPRSRARPGCEKSASCNSALYLVARQEKYLYTGHHFTNWPPFGPILLPAKSGGFRLLNLYETGGNRIADWRERGKPRGHFQGNSDQSQRHLPTCISGGGLPSKRRAVLGERFQSTPFREAGVGIGWGSKSRTRSLVGEPIFHAEWVPDRSWRIPRSEVANRTNSSPGAV